jgi:hypothetical protein
MDENQPHLRLPDHRLEPLAASGRQCSERARQQFCPHLREAVDDEVRGVFVFEQRPALPQPGKGARDGRARAE